MAANTGSAERRPALLAGGDIYLAVAVVVVVGMMILPLPRPCWTCS